MPAFHLLYSPEDFRMKKSTALKTPTLARKERIVYPDDMPGMERTGFSALCRYIGFGQTQLDLLRGVFPLFEPSFPAVVDAFYRAILEHPVTRTVLADPQQVERLKTTLHQWLAEIFTSPRDEAYLERRNRVGMIHVKIGLPQLYVFGAMGLIRSHLEAILDDVIREPISCETVRDTLNKALDLDLALLSDSYLEADKLKVLGHKEHLAAIGAMAVSLAHEVKNPLSGISGAIQILSSRAGAAQQEIFEEIQRQIVRLDRLVEDLLQFGRPITVKAGSLPLGPLTQRVFSVLKEGPEFRNVTLALSGEDLDIPVPVDDGLMQQTLLNLFLNAAQAMDGRGAIRVAGNREAGHLVMNVSDTGPGIPPEEAARIFEPFFTTKPKGSGLGLAICRKVVEAHGGTIALKPNGSPGAAFEIRLPL